MAGETNPSRNVNRQTPNKESLKIGCRNVDGLRDDVKRKKLFLLLKSSPNDIFFLQETHCTPDDEKKWEKDWDNPILFSNGTNRKRGVAILIKRSCNLTPMNTIRDNQGRYIITEIPMAEEKITLCNIYGPNEDSPSFFQNVIKSIEETNPTKLIIGGDWNVTQTFELDRFGSKNDYGQNSREIIHAWMNENNLVDIWRIKNPNTRRYTFIRKRPYIHGSRLDYFLISSSLINSVKEVNIGIKFLSDHAPINLDILVTKSDRGKGYFKLNTSRLKNPEYINLINNTIDNITSQYESQLDPQQLWEFLKYKVRHESIKFGAREKQNNTNEITRLESEILDLQLNSSITETEREAQMETLKNRLDDILVLKVRGIQIRSRANQIELDEKSTKYFYKQEILNNNRKKIDRLNINDKIIEEPIQILKELQKFF